MKRFTLFVMLIISSVSFAQLKKVDVVKPTFIGSAGSQSVECTKLGNTYTFVYADLNFPNIKANKEFSFNDVDNTFEDLYKTIADGFENMPKEDVNLSLPDYLLTLKYKKTMGIVSLYLESSRNGSGVTGSTYPLTKKQVDKLFGKKK